jgi:hypothetical protein
VSRIKSKQTTFTAPTMSIVTSSTFSGGFSAAASGTYTLPAGCIRLEIEGVGGGAGGDGGSSSNVCGSPGAGGGYFRKVITSLGSFTSCSFSVGIAGTAGAAASNGGNGGATSIGPINGVSLLGNGGSRGGAVNGGASSGGDINITGQGSMHLVAANNTWNQANSGGNSMLGLGAPGGRGNSGIPTHVGAGVATGYGAGGGGGFAGLGVQFGGSAGSEGILIIREFYN